MQIPYRDLDNKNSDYSIHVNFYEETTRVDIFVIDGDGAKHVTFRNKNHLYEWMLHVVEELEK
jgi:hypothetical protein